METVRIDVRSDDPAKVVVAVAGEVDMAVHDLFLERLAEVIRGAGTREVIVDLSETSFMDSGGIRVLIEGRRLAYSLDVVYLVTGVKGLVQTVLEVSGVLNTLTAVHRP